MDKRRYCGVASTDPRSQRHYYYDQLAKHVNIKRENLHVLDGTAPRETWAAACEAHEAAIALAGGLDLVFSSTGADGHVARNEPGSSLTSRTRPKTLAHDTRTALAERWGCGVAAVPGVALTVGVGTIMAAREVLVLFASVHRAHVRPRGSSFDASRLRRGYFSGGSRKPPRPRRGYSTKSQRRRGRDVAIPQSRNGAAAAT